MVHELNIYLEQTNKGLKATQGMYGYVIEMVSGDQIKTKEVFEEDKGTAHETELMAIHDALHRLTKPCIVTIYSTHGFFKSAVVGHWLKKWKENDWLNAKGKPVANIVIWKALDVEMQKHTIIMGNQSHKYQEWLLHEMKQRRKQDV